MPRHTHEKVLRVRFRTNQRSIKSVLVMSSDHKGAKQLLGDRRVLRVGKVSQEEIQKTGEFFDVVGLMKELKKDQNKPRPELLSETVPI